MLLSDKYRPRRLAQIVGQGKAIEKIRRLAVDGLGGRSFWISGKSGQGKTTTARCIAAEIADPFFVQEIDAGGMMPSDVEAINQTWWTCGWGKGGRAWIINEAHGLRKDTLRALLVLLEPGNVPDHCVVIFTTTTDGMTLFEDGKLDAGPLLSRCSVISLTSQGIAPVFGRFACRVAGREGLNGKPVEYYIKKLNSKKGNLRALLQSIEDGEMLE